MRLGKFNYAGADTPKAYRCKRCGVHGVKLWREANLIFADHVVLLCAACLCRRAKCSVARVDAAGRIDSDFGRTDQIGGFLPAVPVPDGTTFWGYTSVPDDGCRWWRELPLQGTK